MANRPIQSADRAPRHLRIGSDWRDFLADLRANADLVVFIGTIGIIAGALATVAAAFAWSFAL